MSDRTPPKIITAGWFETHPCPCGVPVLYCAACDIVFDATLVRHGARCLQESCTPEWEKWTATVRKFVERHFPDTDGMSWSGSDHTPGCPELTAAKARKSAVSL